MTNYVVIGGGSLATEAVLTTRDPRQALTAIEALAKVAPELRIVVYHVGGAVHGAAPLSTEQLRACAQAWNRGEA